MISIEQTLNISAGQPKPRFNLEDDELVAAAWSRLVEPGDTVAGALVNAIGQRVALQWVYAAIGSPDHQRTAISGLCNRLQADAPFARKLNRALNRWAPRMDGLEPGRDLAHLAAMSGELLVRGSANWPPGLNDLGDAQPHCLWVRSAIGTDRSQPAELPAPGTHWLTQSLARSVALVGARACTDYGTGVTHELASGLTDRGFTVVSGGAYGIDAAAHRGALAVGGETFGLLAGGVDRLYPAGNARLLRAITEEGGALMSEVPPGAVPSRTRFLQRNRLIAALSATTVVVEAAWRSGSLNTASHAQAMFRPVGAVPGPVTSMASAGTHRLLREQGAVCVTDAAEVAELAGAVGQDLAPVRQGSVAEYDNLNQEARRVYDALPVRSPAAPESVARSAGLSVAEALAGLGELELLGIAAGQAGLWKRNRK